MKRAIWFCGAAVMTVVASGFRAEAEEATAIRPEAFARIRVEMSHPMAGVPGTVSSEVLSPRAGPPVVVGCSYGRFEGFLGLGTRSWTSTVETTTATWNSSRIDTYSASLFTLGGRFDLVRSLERKSAFYVAVGGTIGSISDTYSDLQSGIGYSNSSNSSDTGSASGFYLAVGAETRWPSFGLAFETGYGSLSTSIDTTAGSTNPWSGGSSTGKNTNDGGGIFLGLAMTVYVGI